RMNGADDHLQSNLADNIGVVAGQTAAAPGWRQAGSSWPERLASGTVKEKLHAYLTAHPAGASSCELLALLFSGAGSDPELGSRIIAGVLAGDANFGFDATTGLWSLSRASFLLVPVYEADFVVVDLETTSGRPAPACCAGRRIWTVDRGPGWGARR